MWHRGELSSNAAQGEEQTTIKHKCCRRSDSPYNALMVRPRRRKAKQLAANRECQNSGLSQKSAQPRAQPKRCQTAGFDNPVVQRMHVFR
jgi:hypothetical protein